MRQAAPLLLAILAGCASDDELRSRLLRTELVLESVERRVDELAQLRSRVEALEGLQAVRPPADDEALRARIASLEAELLALRGAPPAGGAAASEAPRGPTELPAPPGLQDARAPRAGEPVPVLSVGGGGLLLVQGQGGLLRVELFGVEPPARAEEYAASALLRARHQPALGAAALQSDEAFERARAHLQELLAGAQVTLDYPPQAAGSAGTARAFVSVRGERGARDLGAAMIQDGFALAAAGAHDRAREYAALEAEARAAGRGLFAPR